MSLKGFNLLQGNTAPPDAWDKVYDWVTNVGRVVVILVEVIVLFSFVTRVVVDTQAKDLIERNQQNSARLAALRPRELGFIDQQDKFSAYKLIWEGGSSYEKAIREINQNLPSTIKDLSLIVRGSGINLTGQAPTSEVSKLENALKQKTEIFSDVIVSEVEAVAATSGSTSGGGNSTFTIQIKIKDGLDRGRTKIPEITGGS